MRSGFYFYTAGNFWHGSVTNGICYNFVVGQIENFYFVISSISIGIYYPSEPNGWKYRGGCLWYWSCGENRGPVWDKSVFCEKAKVYLSEACMVVDYSSQYEQTLTKVFHTWLKVSGDF